MNSHPLTKLQDIMDELMSSTIGGDINDDHSHSQIVKHGNVEECEVHCWDGRRFKMTLEQLPNGCAYDADTGLPIT